MKKLLTLLANLFKRGKRYTLPPGLNFRTIFTAAPDAVIVIDEKGNIRNWNPRAEALFGWPAAEVIGRPLHQYIIPPAYRQAHQTGLQRFLQTKEGKVLNRTVQMRALDRAGKEFDVALSISPAQAEGQYLFIGFIRDITEQKEAEKLVQQLNTTLEQKVEERTGQLFRSEQKYRSFFVDNPLPMWVIDIGSFQFLDVNKAALRHYGYNREEFLSMTALDIRPPEEIERYKKAHHPSSLSNRQQNRGRWRHRRKDGSIIHVEVMAQDIWFEDRTARLIIVNDVTMRVLATKTLQHNQQLLMAIFNNLDALIYIKDLQGRYRMVNRRFREKLQRSNEEITGKTDFDLFTPEVARAIREVDDRAIKHPDPVTEQETITANDSLRTYISVKSTLLDAKGRPVALLGISTDITTIKAVERELVRLNEELETRVSERTAQLETANKELEAYSYSISHDLRAPVRAIHGFTEILEEEYVTKLDDEAKRIASVIKKNAVKMGQLIDGLLTFSRTARKDINRQPIDTTKLVKEIIAELHAPDNIQWQIEPLPSGMADPAAIRQVWINLLSNAIKYTSKTPQPHIVIGSYQELTATVYYIKDNGAGFDPAYSDKIFKVFQRLHRSADFEGTGVGLSIVEKIITKHGGRIWVEAAVDKGATFYFTIPSYNNHTHETAHSH